MMNTICISSFSYTYVITYKNSIKINVATDNGLTKEIAEIESDIKQKMKLEWLCKVGSDYESNSWPDRSVG